MYTVAMEPFYLTGCTRNQALVRARQALASDGIAAVRKLVDQELLPVLVLAAI